MTCDYLIDQLDPRAAAVELASIEFSWTRPDSVVTSERDWFQVSTPSSKEFYLNGVAFCSVTGSEGMERIKRVIEEFRRRKVQFRWTIGPSTRPKDLEALLLAEGLKRSSECLGMVRSTNTALFQTTDPSISIERVGPNEIIDYARACALGWGSPTDMEEAIRKDMERSIAHDGNKIQYFLARRDGRLAGSGVLCVSSSSGYMKGTSVVPSERTKGVYRALLQHRIKILNQLDIPLATVQAIAETSAPICRNFGFEEVCKIYQYIGS